MPWNQQKRYAIGIDTGTKTGLAIYDREAKKLTQCSTLPIHRAMKIVEEYKDHKIIVVVEDARKATFGRANAQYRAQGAGSVKRDASIWEDYLSDMGVEFQMRRPNKQGTKLPKETFFKITGYSGLTSTHSRDAAMMVWGM